MFTGDLLELSNGYGNKTPIHSLFQRNRENKMRKRKVCDHYISNCMQRKIANYKLYYILEENLSLREN